MKSLLAYFLVLLPVFGWTQLTIDVSVLVGREPVALNQTIALNDQQMRLEQVRFYLSGFRCYKNDKLVYSDQTTAYLVDLEIDSTQHIVLNGIGNEQVDRIAFLFGVDSLTNTSGAMGGALDPMYGMYWSWQSGYINCKIEGSFQTPLKKAFQFHLGGYAGQFASVQEVSVPASGESLYLMVDLAPLIHSVLQSQEEMHVMSPCIKAVEYARLLAGSIATVQ